mmetsp:Transcript_87593/g.151663  ORF Transcript_87593/g.151663 Transcript_87593/m.151663 type:complete len:493 (+) Transcript_87593:91-1569(+)
MLFSTLALSCLVGQGHGLRQQVVHESIREGLDEDILHSPTSVRQQSPSKALALLFLSSDQPVAWQGLAPTGAIRGRVALKMSAATMDRAQTVVQRPRKIARKEKSVRLPVWPAWNGIIFILLDFLGQKELAAKAEDLFGGRVCPMMLNTAEADPFVLAVHHRHSFLKFDPFRAAFRFLLPEGFPAHPHRGFETLTYVLPGRRGLLHRDSMGLKMEYGDGECQWMTAGSGILHEEMWSNDNTDISDGGFVSDSELYQIWLNLPSNHKMTKPRIQLLRPTVQQSASSAPPEEVAVIDLPTVSPSEGVSVRVLAGQVGDVASKVETFSDVSIMHTTIAPGSTWDLPLPADFTAMIYVRKGKSLVSSSTSGLQPMPLHELVVFERADAPADAPPGTGPTASAAAILPDGIRLSNAADDASDVADVFLLAGRPLREPVVSAGSFVMNTEAEIRQAQIDFSIGPLSRAWDHELPDDQWKSHVAETYRLSGLSPPKSVS